MIRRQIGRWLVWAATVAVGVLVLNILVFTVVLARDPLWPVSVPGGHRFVGRREDVVRIIAGAVGMTAQPADHPGPTGGSASP